jgi:hypothetical protein
MLRRREHRDGLAEVNKPDQPEYEISSKGQLRLHELCCVLVWNSMEAGEVLDENERSATHSERENQNFESSDGFICHHSKK